ncbi:MAG: CvpA family protein [Verrucomicrobiales bacterium]
MFENLNFNDLSTGGVIGLIVVVFAVLGFVKGLVKLLFALLAVALAAYAGWWGYQNGHSIAANIVEQPEPWMSTAVALIAGVGVYSLCRSVLGFLTSGFNSTGAAKKVGFGPPAGLFGLLVGAAMAYGAVVGVRYLGSVAELRHLDENLENPQEETSRPLFARLKKQIDESKPGRWLREYDFLNDEEGEKLAKALVAQKEKVALSLREDSGELLKLVAFDQELAALAKERNYAALLSHPKVKEALKNPQVREALQNLDFEKLTTKD